MTVHLPVDIRAVSAELLPQFLHFFDHVAFTDNPAWSGCYCHFPHADPGPIKWEARTAAENRAASCIWIKDQRMRGYLAFADGAAVGWCNASSRHSVAPLLGEPEPLAERTGSIVCFVVAPAWRGRGIATALLHAACDGLAAQGFAYAEGYPKTETASEAARHFGTPGMYRAAGFSVVRESEGRLQVRKRLNPAGTAPAA